MLTYLPLPTFNDSAKVLTTEHLKESLRNCCNIIDHNREYNRIKLTALQVEMEDHPGAAMWRGYEGACLLYGWACARELDRREEEIGRLKNRLNDFGIPNLDKLPPWFFFAGKKDESDKATIMNSHSWYLMKKNETHYVGRLPELKTPYFVPLWYPKETFPTVDPIFASQLPFG